MELASRICRYPEVISSSLSCQSNPIHFVSFLDPSSSLLSFPLTSPLHSKQYAQELLQTFSLSLGEVSLIPASGGVFTISLYHTSSSPTNSTSKSTFPSSDVEVQETLLWDRKRDGGFPETKELKSRVRNVIDPKRDLGHVDRSLKKGKEGGGAASSSVEAKAEEQDRKQEDCKDCN
jgi:predicted Rdx family selenoprotein